MGESLATLDAALMDASTLYSSYAERYALYECQLAIVVCAAFPDQPLVNELYVSIIDRGMRPHSASPLSVACRAWS